MHRIPYSRNLSAVSDAVERVAADNETGQQNLKIQGNEFAHGLQNTAFKLNKAVHSLKTPPQIIGEISQKLSLAAHNITEALHNFHPADLKTNIKKSLQDVTDHVHTLSQINLTEEGGRHINAAINTILKTVQKLEINAKFLGNSKEDIKNGIEEIVKKTEDTLNKITKDNEKVVIGVRDQLRKLIEVTDIIVKELEEYINHNPNDNSEKQKVLQEVSQNIEETSNNNREAIKHPSNLADVKSRLSSSVTSLANELKKLVAIEEGDAKVQTLDKITKTVLIEGLAGAKNLATHLEVIAEHQEK